MIFAPFCGFSFTSIRSVGRNGKMSIDKNKIKTQDEVNEPAPMDKADERAEAEMKRLEDKARRDVAEGLQKQGEPEREED